VIYKNQICEQNVQQRIEKEVENLLAFENKAESMQSLLSINSTKDEDRKKHKVMCKSLLVMWNDFNNLLEDRNLLLQHSKNFYCSAEEFGNKLSCLEQYLNWTKLPSDKTTAKFLIKTLSEMFTDVEKWSNMCTYNGRTLMTFLTKLNDKSAELYKAQASFRGACSSIECSLESLFQRLEQVRHRHDKRKRLLLDSLKLRQWEDEVEKELRWFDDFSTDIVHAEYGGFGKDHIDELLLQLEESKQPAQLRLESAKSLRTYAKSELISLDEKTVREKISNLDGFCENVIRDLEERIKLLKSIQKFHITVDDTKVSLNTISKKLEKGIFSVDPEIQSEQFETHISSVHNSVDPLIKMANNIFSESKGKNTHGDLKGLKPIVQFIITTRDEIIEIINNKKKESKKFHERWIQFQEEHRRLSEWEKYLNEITLNTSNKIFHDYKSAVEVLSWLKQQEKDLELKSSEYKNLIEKANVLLKSGLFDSEEIYSLINPMKCVISDLHSSTKMKIHTVEMFLSFVDDYEKMLVEMKKLEEKMSLAHLKKFDKLSSQEVETWNKQIQSLRERTVECLQRKTGVIAELKGTQSNIDKPTNMLQAINLIESLYTKVQTKKLSMTNEWFSWQYRSGFNKEVGIEKQALHDAIDDLRSVIRNIVGELIEKKKVVLGSSVEESQQIFEDLCKKENSLKLLKVDIDETVKKSEVLGIKDSTSIQEMNQLKTTKIIKELLNHFNEAQTIVDKYQQVIISALRLHKEVIQMKNILLKSFKSLENRSSLEMNKFDEQINNDDDFVNKFVGMLINNHYDEKNRIEERYNQIVYERIEIEDLIRDSQLEESKQRSSDRDLDLCLQPVHESFTKWKEAWRSYQDNLEAKKFLKNFFTTHNKHLKSVKSIEERFDKLEKCFLGCEQELQIVACIKQMTEIKSELQNVDEIWHNFKLTVSTTSEDPMYAEIQNEIKKMETRLKVDAKRIESLLVTAKSLKNTMEKLMKSESSNFYLRKELEKIRQNCSDDRLKSHQSTKSTVATKSLPNFTKTSTTNEQLNKNQKTEINISNETNKSANSISNVPIRYNSKNIHQKIKPQNVKETFYKKTCLENSSNEGSKSSQTSQADVSKTIYSTYFPNGVHATKLSFEKSKIKMKSEKVGNRTSDSSCDKNKSIKETYVQEKNNLHEKKLEQPVQSLNVLKKKRRHIRSKSWAEQIDDCGTKNFKEIEEASLKVNCVM